MADDTPNNDKPADQQPENTPADQQPDNTRADHNDPADQQPDNTPADDGKPAGAGSARRVELGAFAVVYVALFVAIASLGAQFNDHLDGIPLFLVAAVGATSAAACVWLWEHNHDRLAAVAAAAVVAIAFASAAADRDEASEAAPPSTTETTATTRTTRAPTSTATSSPPIDHSPTPIDPFACEVPADASTLPITDSFAAPRGVEGIGATTGLTFDGTNLRVATDAANVVAVTLDGSVLGEAPTEPTPLGVTWDGEALWAFVTDTTEIVRSNDQGVRLGSIDAGSIIGLGTITGGDLAWDDGALWWANSITAYRLSPDGDVLATVARPAEISGVEWDGSRLWLGFDDFPSCSYVEVTDHAGGEGQTFRLPPIAEMIALAWADDTLWVVGSDLSGDRATIYRLDISAVD